MLVFNKKYIINKKTNVFSTKNISRHGLVRPSKILKVGTKVILCALIDNSWIEIKELNGNRSIMSKTDMENNCTLSDKKNKNHKKNIIKTDAEYRVIKTISCKLGPNSTLLLSKGNTFKITSLDEKHAYIQFNNIKTKIDISEFNRSCKLITKKPFVLKIDKINNDDFCHKCETLKIKKS